MVRRTMLILAALYLLSPVSTLQAHEKDTRVYEMRTYWANPGKFEAMQQRFKDHALKLFARHGVTSIGYWTPIENPENKLIYVLAYPNVEARTQAFKAFGADEAWSKAVKESEANGPLVMKSESVLMAATDYSPSIQPTSVGNRVFELRVYNATPGKLDNLNARFRDHTCKLFEKHGMTNVAYWTPLPDQKDKADMLIYVIAHKSPEAAKASFDNFRKDEAWIAARKASEEKAGGSLTAKDGVKSTMMQATEYSPMK